MEGENRRRRAVERSGVKLIPPPYPGGVWEPKGELVLGLLLQGDTRDALCKKVIEQLKLTVAPRQEPPQNWRT